MQEGVAKSAVAQSSRARLFGAFRLAGPSGEDITPVGRKARALLAYLILTPGPVTRSQLAGLLWGDRGPEQARGSVRQALYELRELSEGPQPALRVERASAEIVRDRLVCDLDELRALGAGADACAFAELMGEAPQDLLTDLDDVDPDFDDWLAGQRARRGEERQSLGLAVANRALAAGDAAGAARLADRLLAAEPFDEAVARLAMQARSALGDRAGVRQTFARHARAVREELGIEPSADLVTLEAGLSAGSKAPSHTADHGRRDAPLEPAASAAQAPRRARRVLPLAAAAVAIAALAGAGAWRWLDSRPRPDVLRVDPLTAPASDAPAQALRVGLSADLARMVLGNDARLVVEDPRDAGDGARTPADYILAGEARSGAGVINVNLRLLDGRRGAILWSQSFSEPSSDLDAARTRIAARAADVSICTEGGPRPPPRDIDAETMRLYLEGCEQKHGDWALASRLLLEAAQRRPDFAHAWAMASAATESAAPDGPEGAPFLARAHAYARKALALDPAEGEAYSALAALTPGIERWPQRMAVLEQGHRAAPGNDVLDNNIARELMTIGRFDEALTYSETATQQDPFSRSKADLHIRLLGFTGQTDRAEAVAADALRRWPGDAQINGARFRVAAFTGQADLAQRLLADPRAADMTPAEAAPWPAILAYERTPTAANRAAAARRVKAGVRPGDVPSIGEALLQLALIGDVDGAYRLAAAIPDRALSASWPLFYPGLAAFRADPRFMAFAARQGLVDVWRRTGRWPDFCRTPGLPYDCAKAAARS